jgi:hypothetical protein
MLEHKDDSQGRLDFFHLVVIIIAARNDCVTGTFSRNDNAVLTWKKKKHTSLRKTEDHINAFKQGHT